RLAAAALPEHGERRASVAAGQVVGDRRQLRVATDHDVGAAVAELEVGAAFGLERRPSTERETLRSNYAAESGPDGLAHRGGRGRPSMMRLRAATLSRPSSLANTPVSISRSVAEATYGVTRESVQPRAATAWPSALDSALSISGHRGASSPVRGRSTKPGG